MIRDAPALATAFLFGFILLGLFFFARVDHKPVTRAEAEATSTERLPIFNPILFDHTSTPHPGVHNGFRYIATGCGYHAFELRGGIYEWVHCNAIFDIEGDATVCPFLLTRGDNGALSQTSYWPETETPNPRCIEVMEISSDPPFVWSSSKQQIFERGQ